MTGLETALSVPKTAETPGRKRRALPSGGVRLATIAAVLLLWWAVTAFGTVPALFLPSPQAVAKQFWLVATEGYVDATLLQHSLASLGRVFAALAVALLTAVPAGIAIGLSRTARAVLDPLIETLRPIPPLAYLPLIIIWFGIGEGAKVLILVIAVFAPVAITTAAGVSAVPRDRLQAAQSLGASRWQVIRHVILPNSLPAILTGARIGLGVGWSTLVAAELVAATRGLGFMIQSAAQFLGTDTVIMGITVIAAIAVLLEATLRWTERRLAPWHGKMG